MWGSRLRRLFFWENSIHATTTLWNWVSCSKSCHSMAWISTWNPISRSWSGMDPTDPIKYGCLCIFLVVHLYVGYPSQNQARWSRACQAWLCCKWGLGDVPFLWGYTTGIYNLPSQFVGSQGCFFYKGSACITGMWILEYDVCLYSVFSSVIIISTLSLLIWIFQFSMLQLFYRD